MVSKESKSVLAGVLVLIAVILLTHLGLGYALETSAVVAAVVGVIVGLLVNKLLGGE